MFILFDDYGTIKRGSQYDCIHELVMWTKTPAAKEVYKLSELLKIREYFMKNFNTEILEEIEFYGFTLKRE